jgi:hypothetical protein
MTIEPKEAYPFPISFIKKLGENRSVPPCPGFILVYLSDINKMTQSPIVSLIILSFFPVGLTASPWLWVGYYPWVYSTEEGWLYVEAEQVPMTRHADGEKVAMGLSEIPEVPKSLEGIIFKLDRGDQETTLVYSQEEGGYDAPVLLGDSSFFWPPKSPNEGITIMADLYTYELENGNLLITSRALNHGSIHLEFDFETDTSGTFTVTVFYPRPVGVYRGTFLVEDYNGPKRNILGNLD